MGFFDLMYRIGKFIFSTEFVGDVEDSKQDIYELYEDMLERYDEMVQPLLNKGLYRGAADEINDITFLLKERWVDMGLSKVKPGWNYTLSLEQLAEAMRDNKEPAKVHLEWVLGYRRQVELALHNYKNKKNQ